MAQIEIVILGAGNVAHHLAPALTQADCRIRQIFSRTQASAAPLAQRVKSEWTTDINSVYDDADLYIFAVSDRAIPELAQALDIRHKKVAHTAGSVPLSVLEQAESHGVFYPLQTFSKTRPITFREIPLCIEANNLLFQGFLSRLANRLSDTVRHIDTKQRRQLHLSAVFACNFVNHLYAIAKHLLEGEDIDYGILQPLIRETALKAIAMNPEQAQTGPARRNDLKSMEEHTELLNPYPHLQELYKLISTDIQKHNG